VEYAINDKGDEAEALKSKYSKADSKKSKEQAAVMEKLENDQSELKAKYDKMKKKLTDENNEI